MLQKWGFLWDAIAIMIIMRTTIMLFLREYLLGGDTVWIPTRRNNIVKAKLLILLSGNECMNKKSSIDQQAAYADK